MKLTGFKSSLIIIPLVLASGIGGYYVGNIRSESAFETLNNLDEANKLVASVQTLSAIRSGNQEFAIQLLELRADTSLIILNWSKEKAKIEKEKPVLDALNFASVYREFYKDEYETEFGNKKFAGVDEIQEALTFGSKVESSVYDNFIKKYLTNK